ncbi:TolC family protein [Sphingobacterium litopenaei]|uniref:TolC family protein n=1 Tax=Sphingobacterium litopenaei TaxID=2763500 RepID=A0ABR7YDP0_9SPHI|nr:TolC family protein [Sphingobacterium litopenaei]MBD1429420.1 TolC family protein [Sphingobacterium litopenaei]
MKKIIPYILLAFPFSVQGQTLSIEQLWQNANQNLKYQQNQLQSRIAQQELLEIKTNRIPVFYIDANLQRNLIIPTTPVPAIAFDPNAQEGAIIPLKFATKWSSKAGVQVEWNIFNPTRKVEERQKELEIQKSELDLQLTLQNWKKDATLAYASIVFATEQYNSTQEDTQFYEELVSISKARYEAGRELSSSYIAAQQELERHNIQVYEAWSVLKEADQELRKYTNLDSIQQLSSNFEEILRNIQGFDNTNYDIKSLEVDKSISELQLASVRKQLLPTLTFNGYLGEQYFSNELKLARKEEWFGNSFVNLALRIPLSGYFTSQPTIRKISLNAELIDKQIQEITRNEEIDNTQNKLKISAAEKKLEAYKKIETLALQNKQEQQEAYKAGRILLTDYSQVLMSYKKAKQDVWQAQYDLLKLLID